MDIFAGSLPFKLTEDELKKLFEAHGNVTSAKIIIDKITRQNKGFGFIEMPNDNEALAAIEALNGTDIMGRNIVVNKSEKKEQRTDSAGRSNERRFDHNKSSNNNNNSNNSSSSSSSTPKEGGASNKNFGANKVKGGGFKGDFKKGGSNKGGGSKGKGSNKGSSRGFDDDFGSNYNY